MELPPPYDPYTAAHRLKDLGYNTHVLTIFETYFRKVSELGFSLLTVARRLEKFAERVAHLIRGTSKAIAIRRFNSFGHVHAVEPAFVNQFILSVQLTKSSLPNPALFITLLVQFFDLYRAYCNSIVGTYIEQRKLTKKILELNYYFDLIVNSLQYIELYKSIINDIKDHPLSFNQACRFLRVFDGDFLKEATLVREKFYDLMTSNNIEILPCEKTNLKDKEGRLLMDAGQIERLIKKAAGLKGYHPPLSL